MAKQGLILLVEDREDDILLIKKSFASAELNCPMYVVRDGDEAIAYLKGQRKYARRKEFPLPDLVLLDLKMPGTDGFEVLQWVRSQPALRNLRVIVLTSSQD